MSYSSSSSSSSSASSSANSSSSSFNIRDLSNITLLQSIKEDFECNNRQKLTFFTPDVLRRRLSADQRYYILGRRNELPVVRDETGKIKELVFPFACPFCDSEGSRIGRIAESTPARRYYAMFNLRPVFPGHTMIIPTSHVERYEDIPVDHGQELHDFIQTTIKAVKKTYSVESYNLLVQEGKDSGQSMRHLHIHILPRKTNDIGEREWHEHFKEKEHTVREWTPEERNKEAAKIREYYPAEYRLVKIE